ncbi:MAG: hypothetical protein ACRCS3_15915, partial [Paracoccaceae bacterium]
EVATLVSLGYFGAIFDTAFVAPSVPVQLFALQVDTERPIEGKFKHGTTPALVIKARARPEYSGNIWAGIATHRAGNMVEGQCYPESGVIRSDRMLMVQGWLARLAQVLGVVVQWGASSAWVSGTADMIARAGWAVGGLQAKSVIAAGSNQGKSAKMTYPARRPHPWNPAS